MARAEATVLGMPELPEVETIRRQLEPLLRGAVIIDADAHWSDKFAPALDAVGSQIVEIRRRGKYLLFDLDHEVPKGSLAFGRFVGHGQKKKPRSR